MAILVTNTGENFYIEENSFADPPPSGRILQDISSLASSLRNLTGITRTNLGSVQSTIQSVNPTFNVFAVVSHQRNSESLQGVGTASGRVNFTQENFAYNSSSSNKLSTGKTIVNMTGGSDYSLPDIDGKKWMAGAFYDGTTNGFRGILLWIFLGQAITTTNTVISNTASVTTTSDIFFPSGFGISTFRRIYQVVIGPNGGVSASNVSGNAGWVFSSGQSANSNGYFNTNVFSTDDGAWAFVLGGKNNGDPGPSYQAINGYGMGNQNSSDTSSSLFWAGVNANTTNYVGFIFTGDA